MKYFGKKSLSSVLSGILHFSWYLILVVALLAPIAAGGIIFLSTPTGEKTITSAIQKGNCGPPSKQEDIIEAGVCSGKNSSKDLRDWQSFKNTPIALKLLMIPYLEGILILLLFMIRKSRTLFKNFTNDIVFNRENVPLLSTISKLNIAFGIVTFSLTTLLISLVLFLLCEMVKTGAVLQEEHDLTI